MHSRNNYLPGFALTALLIWVACGFAQTTDSDLPSQGKTSELANGIYLILQDSLEKSEIKEIKSSELLVEYKNEFLSDLTPQPIQYFLVKNSPDVPLFLAEAPAKSKDDAGKSMLNLRLTDENISKLQQFTRDNIGRRLVIVIDGKPITAHKIRAEIKDGKVQITRCTDNACDYLYLKLNEKYQAETSK